MTKDERIAKLTATVIEAAAQRGQDLKRIAELEREVARLRRFGPVPLLPRRWSHE